MIFLLKNLGFLVNFEKSVLQPCQRIFLGIFVVSRDTTLILLQEKVNVIIDQFQLFLSRDQVTVWEIALLIGKLCYSRVVILPVPLYYRSIQRQLILEFLMQKNFERRVFLSLEAKKELIWWVNNLKLSNGRSLVNSKNLENL